MIMKRFVFVIAAIAICTCWTNSVAATRVDDTGTIVSVPSAQMRWRAFVPGRAADHTVETQLNVALRLNLAPWLGKNIRLYHRLAQDVNNEVFTVTWTGQGRLLPGTMRSGERVLVYSGPVNSATLEESISLVITADGRRVVRSQSLQFFFEVDE
jgi:hypothetical protein